MTLWHTKETERVLIDMKSNARKGLANKDAQKRLENHGPNKLEEKGRRSTIAIFFSQFVDVMVLILFIAAVVSLALGEFKDAIVILIIVLLNTLIGFRQELKAEQAMASLKRLSVPEIRVKRDGVVKVIPAEELVPGDIMLVESGNIVPADARIIEAANLRIEEATLTGESEPVEKETGLLEEEKLTIGDRKNMAYMGTIVTYGRGEAVVTETGMDTELGKIATMLHGMGEEDTPLQKRLAKLGKTLALAAFGLIILVAGIALLNGEDPETTVMVAISMAVAAIPEGLPAIVTIALALGAQRMLKKQSLIRYLPAVETLGSVTVICSDKTGTLTQNRMTVTTVVMEEQTFNMQKLIDKGSEKAPGHDVALLLMGGTLCNDAVLSRKSTHSGEELSPEKARSRSVAEIYEAVGDPTEGALVIAAEEVGIPKVGLEQVLPRVSELPFDSVRKRMTTIHAISDKKSKFLESYNAITGEEKSHAAFTKGSADGLLNVSNRVIIGNKIVELSDEHKQRIRAQNEQMAGEGIRVLGIAYKPMEESEISDTASYEKDLVFIGMTGMIDPVRPEVKDAVKTCKEAGIRPIMITGDHPLTALHIAKELGITEVDTFLTGLDLSEISPEELKEKVLEVSVYARVSPEHKMNLINALQEKGHIVSMTGDGVNDAPALKSADIGVAMGITGTDVSKDSSDMVLIDDNFATIVAAVKEGRTIYDNIRKFIKYILAGNTGEIIVMLLAPLLGLGMPLYPIQILWINLVTDGAPGIALGYEPSEKDTMKRPPYKPDESIFARGVGRQILWVGSLVGVLSLLTGFFFYTGEPGAAVQMGHGTEGEVTGTEWQTMIFTTLTFCQMMFALSVRSDKRSLFTMNPFSNWPLLVAVFITFVLQLGLIYIPALQDIFNTTDLSPVQLLTCFGVSFTVIIAVEIEKFIVRLLDKKNSHKEL
ncbi:MAG: cation-translocating P-type ATPase [bacterium]|nr:cation-translocating P-type ATPase [bacterium]